jgi:hypothetical protein
MKQTYKFKSHGINVTVLDVEGGKYSCLIKPFALHGGIRKILARYEITARSQASAAQMAVQIYKNQ